MVKWGSESGSPPVVCPYKAIYSSLFIIFKIEANKIPFRKWMVKQLVLLSHDGTVFCLQKEKAVPYQQTLNALLKKLQTIWFHVYGILARNKNYKDKKISHFWGFGGKWPEKTRNRTFKVSKTVLYGVTDGGFMALCICQNL